MGKPSPPPAPDFVGAAQAQGQANVTAAQNQASLNNPNVTSPYGSQTVTYQPTGPNGDQQAYVNQTLTPEAQAALTSQQNVQAALGGLAQQGIGQAQNILGQPFQYGGPAIQTGLGNVGQAQTGLDTSGIAKQDVNAGMTGQNAILSRLQPQIQQNANALQQQLANQGITPGSEAWNNAMRQQGQQQNDLYTQAALQGIGLDQSANQQGFNQLLSAAGLYNQGIGQNYNQALGAAQFGNTAANQALAQQLQLYNQPLNEITALMSGSQIQSPQFQQYSGGGNIGAAPIMQATTNQGNYNTAAYNSQMQGLGGLYGGLGSIAGAAAGSPLGFFGAFA